MVFFTLLIALAVFAVVSNAFMLGQANRLVSRRSMNMKHEDPYHILKNPLKNKGLSFTAGEREKLGLRGLIPAGEPWTLEDKVDIAMEQLRKKATPIDKYTFLHTIQDSDETLFYAMLIKHTSECMPLVYTPTVGQACLEWSHIYRQVPRGLYISMKDRGHVKEILQNHPNKEVKVIVFTDGERILGLGDLGSNGMGIPIGKLALYTTCAGIDPNHCLPVMIDVGTNTQKIREDKAYIGLRQPRERSHLYDELLSEFFTACKDVYGRNVLLQFEDFGNSNAFRLLEQHQKTMTCFNDDIQGTASVVLAGLYSSLPLTKKKNLSEHRYLFFGAGEAGIGIADLVASAIVKETGCSMEQARERCWFVDSKGLITNARIHPGHKLEHHKKPYAHDLHILPNYQHTADNVAPSTLLDAVKVVQPTALIGVSAQGSTFTKEVVTQLMSYSTNPLIFALSNPTSKAECTATEAYTWTNGQCVFASGSPFDPLTLPDGRHFVPGQGNNAYIFPGVGLGALAANAMTITDEDFLVAAKSLASMVSTDRLAQGCCYPDLKDIRQVSQHIAAAVAEYIHQTGRSSGIEHGKAIDWVKRCGDMMYSPSYEKH